MKRFFQYSATLLLLFSQILFASESLELKAIDIDVPEEELISYYKNQYLSDSAKRWLEEIMTNAAEYRPFILQELKEQDAPLCSSICPL